MAAAGFAPAGVVFIAKGMSKFLSSFDSLNKTLEAFNKKMGFTTDKLNKFEKQATRLGNQVIVGLIAGITALTIALGGLAAAGVGVAASFEHSFSEVTKTVDAFLDRTATMEDGVIRLTEEGQKFRNELKALSGEIPVTFEKLSEIAGLGGQLGIVEGLAGDEAREALIAFTETVAGLAEATSLTQQKAATGLAQISNIFRSNIDDIGLNIERLGATLVELGNTSATTESLILNFAQRIAGAGKTVGLTQAEVLGIGTAFASIGITAEAGSTAVNRSLLIMNEAVALSSESFADNTSAIATTQEAISDLQADLVRLEAQTGITGKSIVDQKEAFLEAGGAVEDWGRLLGDARREQLFQTQTEVDRLTQKLNQLRITQGQALTTEVFDELLRVVQQTQKGAELTAETFQELFTEDPAEAFTLFVEGLAEEGNRAGEVLDRIGLGSVEATRAFLAIAGASETVRDRIMASTRAFEENRALTDEVSIRYATLTNNLKEFMNIIRGVSDTLFSPLLEPLIKVVEWGKDVVLVLGTEIPEVINALANKFGPELREIFDEIFGPTGLFGAGEITTPEGFVLSGDLIGVEPASITAIKNSFDDLIETINSLDVSNLSDQAIAFRDTIVPIWTGAVDLVTENADTFIGAVKGLIAILGGVALIAAASKAAAAIGFLATPLGTLSLITIGFGIAWENNFLNIQETTANVVTKVKESIAQLIESIQSIDLTALFENLTGGAELETPEGFIISGEQIGIEPGFFDDLGAAAEGATDLIGDLTTMVIQVPVDQISGLIEMFNGLVTIIDNLTSSIGTAEGVLEGFGQIISGFVDSLAAPLQNLAQFFGFELDTTAIKNAAFNAAKNFVEGFLAGFAGAEIEDLGSNFTELWASILELGESPAIQAIITSVSNLGPALVALGEALSEFGRVVNEFLGLEADASFFTLLGTIVGFVAKVGVDQLINVVEALTGFVVVLDGLASLDFSQVTEGLTQFGIAVASIPLDTAQRIGEIFGADVKLSLAQGVLDFIAFLQETMDEGIISLDIGTAISEWVTTTTEQIIEGINSVIASVQEVLAFEINLQDLIDLDTQITEDIDNASKALFGFFVNLDAAITTTIDDLSTRLFNSFSGILSTIDLGLPSFQSILDKAKEVTDKIKGFFLGIFEGFEFPDFGLLEKLADLGIIDLEVETPDAEGLGTDLAQGIVDEVEAAEQSWKDAWLEFLLAPIEEGKEALGIQSPSTLTEAMAADVIAGYALGLSDLTPIEEALMNVDSLILNAFMNLSTELISRTIPTVQATDRVFTALYTDTLPRTTSAIVDGVTPAKLDLAEVNTNDLIPSVDELIGVEEQLINTFEDVVVVLDRLVSLKEKAKDRSKSLTKEIEKLAKAYLSLAAAIGSASQAGDGMTAPPTTPVGTPFQEGGSFIVPSNVGTEGMPIRVHANELVQIIPAQFVHRMQSIPLDVVPSSVKSPQLSGAPITNIVANNQQANTSTTKEFHLHVSEAPTSDVRDSFDLMETLS